MGTSSLQPCTETLYWYHKSQVLPESTVQRSVELVVTVGGTLVLARVLCNGTGVANIMQQWAL